MPIRRLIQASLTNDLFSKKTGSSWASRFLAEIECYSSASILSIKDSILLKTGA